MSGAAMYFSLPPSESTASRTSGVNDTGENTAMEPEASLTIIKRVYQYVDTNRYSTKNVPNVPRAPNLRRPNRAKGRLRVTTSGVTLRMTITCDGLVGKSLGMVAFSLY